MDAEPGATQRRLAPVTLAAAAGVVVLIGLHLIADLTVLVVFSVVIAVLLVPVQGALIGRGLTPGLAAVAAVLLYVVVLVVAALAILVGLLGFLRDLPTYRSPLESTLSDASTRLGGSGAPVIDVDAIEAAIRAMASGVLGALATLGLSIFIVAYLLLEGRTFPAKLRWSFGDGSTAVVRGAALADRLRTYIVARAVLGGIAAILDTILLVILGVPNALLWGVLSFLLSFIPNIGFIIALIPPTIMGLLVGGPLTALAVVIGYSVINIAIDYVVQPRFIGSEVDLSAVVVTVSLLFWAVVLGGAGALLAVPLTIVAAALFDAFDDGRPLARLLGAATGPDPDR